MLERFTEHGRQAVALAQDEARQLHAQGVGVEHLLLAILQIDGGKIGRDVLGVSAAQVREILATGAGVASSGEPGDQILFTQNARRVMNAAMHDVMCSDEYVDASHLLARILATGDEVINRVLAALNVNRDQVCRRAKDLISAQQRGRTSRASPSSKPQTPATGEELIRRVVHRHDALVAALRRYGRHDNGCPAPSAPCTCGLSTALLGTDDDR